MNFPTFKPAKIGTLAVILLCPLFIYLGFWQLDRAAQKNQANQLFYQQQNLPTLTESAFLTAITRQEDLRWRKVNVNGQFLPAPHLLLDNQIYQRRVGYHVYSPFQLQDSKQIIWVNRGWIPLANSRAELPNLPQEEMQVKALQGDLAPPPSIPLTLHADIVETLSPTWSRVQTIDFVKLKAVLPAPTMAYFLRLQQPSTTFVRQTQPPTSGAEKHEGYAFQWFSFAAAVLIIYLLLAFRRPLNKV